MNGEATVVSWGGRSNGGRGRGGRVGQGHRHSGGSQGRARAGGDHSAKGRASPQTSEGLGRVRGRDARKTGPLRVPAYPAESPQSRVRKKEITKSIARKKDTCPLGSLGHSRLPDGNAGSGAGAQATGRRGPRASEPHPTARPRAVLLWGKTRGVSRFPRSRRAAAPSFLGEDNRGVRCHGRKETKGKDGIGHDETTVSEEIIKIYSYVQTITEKMRFNAVVRE